MTDAERIESLERRIEELERLRLAGRQHSHSWHSHDLLDTCKTDCALVNGPCGRRHCPWGYHGYSGTHQHSIATMDEPWADVDRAEP